MTKMNTIIAELELLGIEKSEKNKGVKETNSITTI